MAFRPTDEQQAILQHDSENHARVLAGPGTGKSTTMVSLFDSLLEKDNTLRVKHAHVHKNGRRRVRRENLRQL